MSDFSINCPVNSVSFGQVSTAILREFHKKGMEPCIFPIGGNLDLSTQKEDKEFSDWLTNCSNKALYSHNRDIPTFKLWHLNGSLESLSRDQALFTFYELDQPTKQEINIAKNNTKKRSFIFNAQELSPEQVCTFLIWYRLALVKSMKNKPR